MRPTATDVTVAWSVCVCVSSVTLVHPAKVAGRIEMPFGRETRVVPSNRSALVRQGRGSVAELKSYGCLQLCPVSRQKGRAAVGAIGVMEQCMAHA